MERLEVTDGASTSLIAVKAAEYKLRGQHGSPCGGTGRQRRFATRFLFWIDGERCVVEGNIQSINLR